jgi:phage-related baseplate assembly protein
MLRFLPPDLSQLPPPQLIDVIDYETILQDQKDWVLARWAECQAIRPDLPPLDTLGLETEPMTIILEAFAYREVILRSLVNDKARAVPLAGPRPRSMRATPRSAAASSSPRRPSASPARWTPISIGR